MEETNKGLEIVMQVQELKYGGIIIMPSKAASHFRAGGIWGPRLLFLFSFTNGPQVAVKQILGLGVYPENSLNFD